MEATLEAEETWIKTVQANGETRAFQESCTPGYRNYEGNREGRYTLIDEAYSPGPTRFRLLLESWREVGSLDGFEACLLLLVSPQARRHFEGA